MVMKQNNHIINLKWCNGFLLQTIKNAHKGEIW